RGLSEGRRLAGQARGAGQRSPRRGGAVAGAPDSSPGAGGAAGREGGGPQLPLPQPRRGKLPLARPPRCRGDRALDGGQREPDVHDSVPGHRDRPDPGHVLRHARRGGRRSRGVEGPVIVRLLVALLVVLGLAAPAGSADDIDRRLREMKLVALPGERPPSIALSRVDGGKATLAEQEGKVVLVYFWATWCGYCRRELPAGVEKVVRQRKGQPFTVLAVNIEEPRDVVAGYVREAGITPPVPLDTSARVARR